MEKEKIENKNDISKLILNEINHINEMKNNNINYENLSLNELKKELNSRNKIINLMNTNNDKLKIELSNIIKNLNELINENGKFLYNFSEDEESIEKLEKILEIRKRDLETSKKINQTFKSQYKLIYNKANQSISIDKISFYKKEIDLMEKNNLFLNTKIKQMQNKNIINTKELLLENKKNPIKLKNYSEEIKTLSHIKNELIKKITRNKRNLENEKLFFKKLEDIYNSNLKEESEENLIKKINCWMNIIKEDINDNVDEIFSKVEMNKSKIVNLIDNQLNDNFKNQNKQKIFLPSLSLANIYNNFDNEGKKNLKKNSSQENINLKKYKIFKNSNSKKNILNINQLSNVNSLNNIFDNKNKKKKLLKSESVKKIKLEKMPLTNLNTFIDKIDYNILSDRNYRELLYKKEQYLEINSRIDSRIKDLIKISENKFNNISSSIKMNQNNLTNLKLQNDLLKKEITNLEKIYSLTKSECLIQKKILENEKNILSLQKITQSNHEISNTGNDILNELNLLNDDKKNNHNTLMMTDNIETRNILGTNISDKNNEETISNRNKKLKEIKAKYINFTKSSDSD